MLSSWKVVFIFICIALVGCRANDEPIAPLLKDIRAKSTAKVDALPDEFLYSPLPFQITHKRQPFSRPQPTRVVAAAQTNDCWQPDLSRSPQSLEQFPLDTLAVKGVIGDSNARWALVQTPEGQLEKIRAGQFIGLNRGRVRQVSSFGIEVQESLPDGLGCWQQRSLKLAVNQPVSVTQ